LRLGKLVGAEAVYDGRFADQCSLPLEVTFGFVVFEFAFGSPLALVPPPPLPLLPKTTGVLCELDFSTCITLSFSNSSSTIFIL
jgi:hypothetical protein